MGTVSMPQPKINPMGLPTATSDAGALQQAAPPYIAPDAGSGPFVDSPGLYPGKLDSPARGYGNDLPPFWSLYKLD